MVISDEDIKELFSGTNFGKVINGNVNKQRELLAATLRAQTEGYWSGHTAYGIAIHGGFIHDAKSGKPKKLTALGNSFMAGIA